MNLPHFNDKLDAFRELLRDSQRVVLTTHNNPDGDALGSLLGMHFILKEMGVDSTMLIPNNYPDFLAWLPGLQEVLIHSKKKDDVEAAMAAADVIISLDYNGAGRLEALAQSFERAESKKVLIDHHPHPESIFDIEFSDVEVSSTAELVYEIAISLVGEAGITLPAATGIFVGIMTDTGSFSYSIASPRTFEIVAKLVGLGVNLAEAQRQVYSTFSEGRMRLLGYSLNEKMKVFPQHKTAFISLSRDELKRFKYSIGDTEGLVNYPLAIEGIVFSALFTENFNHVKVSLRSRGQFPVNEFCSQHFNGGGHRNAAGGKSFVSLAKTEGLFISLLEQYSNQLNT